MGLWGLHPTGLAQGLVRAAQGRGCAFMSTFLVVSLTHSSGHGQGRLPCQESTPLQPPTALAIRALLISFSRPQEAPGAGHCVGAG